MGINDDVTFLSLPPYEKTFDPAPAGTTTCKFWGFGSDGTVGANKTAVKIIGDHTDMYAQAYFEYDSKKSGGLTVSHLRFGHKPILSSYQVNNPDFVACSNQTYVYLYELLEGIKPGGRFMLNCTWSKDELEEKLPASLKREIANKNVQFYTINALDVAESVGLGGRINMVMQSAFFKLANILPLEEAISYLKTAVKKSYGKGGEKIVEMNYAAIDAGIDKLVKIDVPESWKTAQDAPKTDKKLPEFVEKFVMPVKCQQGDKLPVSTFNGIEDGSMPLGMSKYDKAGVAVFVPKWDVNKCIQCNQCSFVCPHSVLRPTLLDKATADGAPATLDMADAKGFDGYKFTMGFSAYDCTGCGNCVDVCPVKDKALTMVSFDENKEVFAANWEYVKDIDSPELPKNVRHTVKGSQFLRPLLEFPGSCAGCGESPYSKLITQLYGDRMVLVNTAGCVAAWGGSSPMMPYTVNHRGHGPAWGYSLFEDEAEYALGQSMGSKTVRLNLKAVVEKAYAAGVSDALKAPMKAWLDGYDEAEGTRARADAFEAALEPYKDQEPYKSIYRRRDVFVKRVIWVFGGDGWAYDIGYGGLDHVLASGENLNFFVYDTEVIFQYRRPVLQGHACGSDSQVCRGRQGNQEKDLGRMAMSYGYVYVAQVAMGADKNQTLKAITEAEAYDGPSIIIGYAPCINHGIRAGMGHAQQQQKRAVESGYWGLYRFNPDLAAKGENPFILDSKAPTMPFRDYLMSETRFASMLQFNPNAAERLFAKAEKDAMERLHYYEFMSKNKI